MADKHENLFYTYSTHHLEDNVTRALVTTLRRLAPVHLRLLVRDVLLRGTERASMRKRFDLLAEPNFEFALQVPGGAQEERLTAADGLIIGINYSGDQRLDFPADVSASSGARVDALVSDVGNGLTLLFEVKLSDSLYREQIRRHFEAFFDPSVSLKEVFLEVTWRDIAEFLYKISHLTQDPVERLLIHEFLAYLDWLRLVGFLGFRSSDFIHPEDANWKLPRCLAEVLQRIGPTLGFEEYTGGYMLMFKGGWHDNLWVDAGEEGVSVGIVVGSGKKWRADVFRNTLADRSAQFDAILSTLRAALESDIAMWLRVHSNFRHSRFRTAWLGNIRGEKAYPTGLGKFVEEFTDPTLNTHKMLSKQEIARVFKDEIAQSENVDEKGRFPKWADIDSYLQYSYFHIDVLIPQGRLVDKGMDHLVQVFSSVLGPLRNAVAALQKW